MRITLFSFFSSVFWSSVLIAGICFLRKAHRFRTSCGIGALVLLYLFCIVRLVLPLELPHAIELGIGEVYPEIYSFLTTDRSYGDHLHFAYLDILVCVWLIGIGILLIRYLICYHKAMRSIIKYASPCGQREYASLNAVRTGIGKSINVSLYTIPHIDVPFGIGVFRKSILLPQNEFTDKELYYILLHEYTHFLNHDILTKTMVSVFCCIFWWHPAAYLLKADLEQTLEMKCDATVARYLNTQEKAAYLRTIISVMKQRNAAQSAPYISTALLRSARVPDIKERFDVVMQCQSGHGRILPPIMLLLLGACVFVLSYAAIPQPVFESPKSTEPDAVDFDPTNAYITQDENGCYWLCIGTQKTIQISDADAAFYQQGGFSIVKECVQY